MPYLRNLTEIEKLDLLEYHSELGKISMQIRTLKKNFVKNFGKNGRRGYFSKPDGAAQGPKAMKLRRIWEAKIARGDATLEEADAHLLTECHAMMDRNATRLQKQRRRYELGLPLHFHTRSEEQVKSDHKEWLHIKHRAL